MNILNKLCIYNKFYFGFVSNNTIAYGKNKYIRCNSSHLKQLETLFLYYNNFTVVELIYLMKSSRYNEKYTKQKKKHF